MARSSIYSHNSTNEHTFSDRCANNALERLSEQLPKIDVMIIYLRPRQHPLSQPSLHFIVMTYVLVLCSDPQLSIHLRAHAHTHAHSFLFYSLYFFFALCSSSHLWCGLLSPVAGPSHLFSQLPSQKVSPYIYIHIYIYTYIYIYVYICIYIYVYIIYISNGLCLSTLPQRVLNTHMCGWLLLILKKVQTQVLCKTMVSWM